MQPKIGANNAARSEIAFRYCNQYGDEIIPAATTTPTFSEKKDWAASASPASC